MYEIAVEKKFSCSHFLRHYHGQNESLHNHDWKVQIKFRGERLKEPEQYLIDFEEVQETLGRIIDKIEEKNLNEIPSFENLNPTAENVACWICKTWNQILPASRPFCVTVWETESASASYYPDDSDEN